MNPAKLIESASLLFSLLLVYTVTSSSAQTPDNIRDMCERDFGQFLQQESDGDNYVEIIATCGTNNLTIDFNTSYQVNELRDSRYRAYYECIYDNGTVFTGASNAGISKISLQTVTLWEFSVEHPPAECTVYGCYRHSFFLGNLLPTSSGSCSYPNLNTTPSMETTMPVTIMMSSGTPMTSEAPEIPKNNIIISLALVSFALSAAFIAVSIPSMIILRLKRIQRQKFAIMRQGYFIKCPQDLDPHFCPVDFHAPVLKATSQVSLFDTLSPFLPPGQSDDDKSLVLQDSSRNKDSSSILIDVKSGDHMTEELDHVNSQDAHLAHPPHEATQLSNTKYPQLENVDIPNKDSKEEPADIRSPVSTNGYIVEESLKQSSSPTTAPKSEYIRQEDLKLKKPGILQWSIPHGQPIKTQVTQLSSIEEGSSGYFTELTTSTEYSEDTLEHKLKPSAVTAHEGALETPAETVLPLSPGSGLSILSEEEYSDNLYSESIIAECALSLSLNPSHFEPVKYEDIEPAVPSYMNTDQPNDAFYQSALT